MLENLIQEGAKFESQAVEVNYGMQKVITGVDFETWVSKVVFYMEEEFPGNSQTKKVISMNADRSVNSYEKYQTFLGTIRAAKEIQAVQSKNMEDIFDLNN